MKWKTPTFGTKRHPVFRCSNQAYFFVQPCADDDVIAQVGVAVRVCTAPSNKPPTHPVVAIPSRAYNVESARWKDVMSRHGRK